MSLESIYTRIAQTCWHSGGHPLEVIADVLEHALGRDEGGEGSAAGRARLAALASGFSSAEPGHQPGEGEASPEAESLDGLRLLAHEHRDLEPGDWQFGDGTVFDARACLRWAVERVERAYQLAELLTQARREAAAAWARTDRERVRERDRLAELARLVGVDATQIPTASAVSGPEESARRALDALADAIAERVSTAQG